MKPRVDFPVVLYTTGSVSLGKVFTPNAGDLQNHFDTPIQIEEVRFLFNVNATIGTSVIGSLAALIRTYIKVGTVDLTNGYVPCCILGSRMQVATELVAGFAAAGAVSVWDYQRWKLPVPMIVAPGATFLPLFTMIPPNGSLTAGNNTAITVHVALIGRSLDKMPVGKLKVPYVSAYIGDTVGGGQQSGDDQLVNKFGVPLHVQRFIGRWFVRSNSNDAWLAEEGRAASLFAGKNLMIKDHAGYHVVGTMTPWHNVFERTRLVLQVDRILEPRGWYTIQLADAPSNNFAPMIAMMGWREEETV